MKPKYKLKDSFSIFNIRGGNILDSEKKIEIRNSTESLIKYWKNYFMKRHTKDIIVNSIIISIALLIYFFSEFIVLAAIIITFCILYLLFIFYFYYLATLSTIKKRRKYYDNLLVILSEEGIQLEGSLGESKTKWEAYSHVVTEKEYYLLFDEIERFLPIPKEPFITEDDRIWFEKKLQEVGIKEK